jgi:secreted PhoX family phosphatase
MSETKDTELHVDDLNDFDETNYPRPAETDFARLAAKAMSRRDFIGSGVAVGTAAFVMGTTALTPTRAQAAGGFGFEPVAANSLDTVTLPKGYSWQILTRWGDPMWSHGVEFDHATRGTGKSQL